MSWIVNSTGRPLRGRACDFAGGMQPLQMMTPYIAGTGWYVGVRT